MTSSPHKSAAQPPLNSDLTQVAQSLHQQYDSSLGSELVTRKIQVVADRFAAASVRSFVPLLVRRYAGAELRGAALP